MGIQAFRYDFTMKELAYFLFKKKICPKCGGQMEKKKCCEIVDGSIFNTNDTPLYIQGSKQVKHYFYIFLGRECGAEITLAELATGTTKGKKGLNKSWKDV